MPEKGIIKLYDGGGLYLQIDAKGRKYWRFQYQRPSDKKRDVSSLGVYPQVTLKQARSKCDELRLLLDKDIDPKQRKKEIEAAKMAAAASTFKVIAMQWYEPRKADKEKWGEQHARRVLGWLKNHIFPRLGNRPINSITPLEILSVAKSVQATKNVQAKEKTYTAHRILGIISDIFAFAVKLGLCQHNPVYKLSEELQTHQTKHYPTITEAGELAELLHALDTYGGTPPVRALLRISPYLFQRPSEVRLMRWCELDLEAGIWTKPAEKMKSRRIHIVPLSRQAIAILKEMWPFNGHYEYVFYNRSKGKPVSDNTCRSVLKRLGYKDRFTPHGWRHCASTILHDKGYDSKHIEEQLAHLDTNKTRGTYNQAQYLQQRKQMLQEWADYLDSLKIQPVPDTSTETAIDVLQSIKTDAANVDWELTPHKDRINDALRCKG